MLHLLLLAALTAQPAPDNGTSTPEELATGALREIITAQHVYKLNNPQRGYACSLEPLVKADLLKDTWTAGTRVDGYTFRLWCEATGTPQATFRAAAVPVKTAKGARLTVCTDETYALRTVDGDAAACFAKGTPVR